MSDSIRRKDAIDVIDEYDFEFPDYMERFVMELRDAMKADLKRDIEELPSAQTERKTGRWLTEHGDHVHAGLRPIYIYCSECGMVSTVMWNYCPNCGARMESEI